MPRRRFAKVRTGSTNCPTERNLHPERLQSPPKAGHFPQSGRPRFFRLVHPRLFRPAGRRIPPCNRHRNPSSAGLGPLHESRRSEARGRNAAPTAGPYPWRPKKAPPSAGERGAGVLQADAAIFQPLTWQLSQFPPTEKAVLPSWQAPHDFAFFISLMVTGLPPALSGKVPVWQEPHLYMPR
jgi:hypothetical protein